MTLIAAWKEENTPILIGDLVVSTLGEFELPHQPLPTRDDLDKLIPKEWHRRIVDTCQKIYMISDTFVLGWCDSKITAKIIIGDVLAHYKNTRPSLADIQNYFQSQTDHVALSSTIIGWVVQHNVPYCFHWCSSMPHEFNVGEAFIEGSGKDAFRDIFKHRYVSGSYDPVNHALSRIGKLLGHEVLYGTNLWNLFGGGFQIIYWRDNSFHLLPSTTFIFLYAKEDGDNILFGFEKRIIKVLNENEIVQTMALRLKEIGAVGAPQMYYTFPINAHPTKTFAVYSNLALTSEYYCIYVDISCRDEMHAECVISVEDSKREPLLKIIKGPDTMEGLALGETLFRVVVNFLKNLDRKALRALHTKADSND
jgi:hypothetical protein